MNENSIVLPKLVHLEAIGIDLHAIDFDDAKFYTSIYSDLNLMHFINDEINLAQIKHNFDTLIDEMNQPKPRYISYVIKHNLDKLGIYGIKLLDSDVLEIGIILRQNFQHQGWSKKIKKTFINEVFDQVDIKKFVAYCRHDNGAENHVNKILGFDLDKQFKHKRKGHLMNKWVLS